MAVPDFTKGDPIPEGATHDWTLGATGARLITNCCHRMHSEGSRHGLVAACAAGAIGIGLVFERLA